MADPEFDIVPPAAIREGRATDAYFERTVETLDHAGKNPTVVVEVTADQFPTGEFEVFAGIEDAAHLLDGLQIDVDALREGQLFDGGPVLRIEGPYLDFARFETALLGFLSHPSGMATSALRARLAAPDSSLLSFGARHVHPSIAAVVERSALVGGLRWLLARRGGRPARPGGERHDAPRARDLLWEGQPGRRVGRLRRGRARIGAQNRAV